MFSTSEFLNVLSPSSPGAGVRRSTIASTTRAKPTRSAVRIVARSSSHRAMNFACSAWKISGEIRSTFSVRSTAKRIWNSLATASGCG